MARRYAVRWIPVALALACFTPCGRVFGRPIELRGAPTTRVEAAADPAWSPDGSELLIPATVAGTPELLLFSRDGLELTETRQLHPGGAVRFVTWLAPGRALMQRSTGGRPTVVIANLREPSFRELAAGGRPSAAPDGQPVVFVRSDKDGLNLYVLQTTDKRRAEKKLTTHMLIRDLSLSPDGKRVAVRYTPFPMPSAAELRRPLAVVRLGQRPTVVPVDAGEGYADFGMAWRDARTLVFGRVSSAGRRHNVFRAVVWDAVTGRQSIAPDQRDVEWYTSRPVWSHDGRYVVYPSCARLQDGSRREDWRTLIRLDTTTGAVREVTFPIELNTRFSLSPDANVVAAVDNTNGLWLGDFQSGAVRHAKLQPAI